LTGPPGEGDAVPCVHRILIVDDHPEIRVLVRSRLRMVDDVEVVGEASNGAEALILVSALAPDVVVLDLEMPVMRGDEAIPRIRELAPGVRVLLYAGADEGTLGSLSEEAKPDGIVTKGRPLSELVDQLRALLDMGPYDVVRVVLGSIPLDQAVTVFDTWVGLNVRILESLARGDELPRDQLGAHPEELQALIGVYAHVGDNFQKAARGGADQVVPIIHLLRRTAAAARRALLVFDHGHVQDFYAAWNYEVPASALLALNEMRDQLLEALPASSADETGGDRAALTSPRELLSDRQDSRIGDAVAAVDRAAAAIDRGAAAQDRAAASIDELTGTYRRGPGHVELQREIARARRTKQPLVVAFLDVDGLKAVNDTRGHEAGDQLLRDVATALRDQLRGYDVIVRHGGDEFLCVLPEMSMATACARMKLIHTALADSPNHWTVSAGLALLQEEDTLETLISRADKALYANRSSRPTRRAAS
jgi:diguanylate cyclase (GGDEF)-like protein